MKSDNHYYETNNHDGYLSLIYFEKVAISLIKGVSSNKTLNLILILKKGEILPFNKIIKIIYTLFFNWFKPVKLAFKKLSKLSEIKILGKINYFRMGHCQVISWQILKTVLTKKDLLGFLAKWIFSIIGNPKCWIFMTECTLHIYI